MTTVILVIHLMVTLALVGIIMVQRSEGGALGIGGGGGGFMTARGAANLLTRLTAVLAAAFFATSIMLAIISIAGSKPSSGIGGAKTEQSGKAPAQAPAGGNGALPKLAPAPAPAPAPSGPQLPGSK